MWNRQGRNGPLVGQRSLNAVTATAPAESHPEPNRGEPQPKPGKAFAPARKPRRAPGKWLLFLAGLSVGILPSIVAVYAAVQVHDDSVLMIDEQRQETTRQRQDVQQRDVDDKQKNAVNDYRLFISQATITWRFLQDLWACQAAIDRLPMVSTVGCQGVPVDEATSSKANQDAFNRIEDSY